MRSQTSLTFHIYCLRSQETSDSTSTTRYNEHMQPDIAQRLIELNRKFYTDFGEAFSATRGRIQPGVRHILDSLDGNETILDLGCGNGELARTLARDGHRGAYLGLDFSLPLLSDADSVPEGFPAEFREVDLTKLSAISGQPSGKNRKFCRSPVLTSLSAIQFSRARLAGDAWSDNTQGGGICILL